MKDQIEPMAERGRLLVSFSELRQAGLFVADQRQILRFEQIALANLRVAQILLRVLDFALQLFQFVLVLLFHFIN